jgi:hypothetical protein
MIPVYIPDFYSTGGPSEALWGARLIDALQSEYVQEYLASEIYCSPLEVRDMVVELLHRAGGTQ